MPKAETNEYFIIHVGGVPKDRLGHLLSLLAREQFFDVRPELVTDVVRFKQKQSHEVRAEDFLVDWIADHPSFKAIEAVNHFREAGRTAGACYSALTTLVEKKLLRKNSPGEYTTLARKHQPKKANTKTTKKAKHDVDHRTFILRAASRNHGRFNTAWMKKQFVADGRTPGNVSPTIAALIKKKQLKRVGDSEYVLSQKAVTPKKMNGADVAAEATHGA